MNTYVPAPDALPLPAPAVLLTVLLHVTFVLHLLMMNVLLGGALVALAARLARRSPDDLHDRTLARVARLLPTLFAGTVTFGVAPLLFMQVLYGRFFYTSSIIMGQPWFGTVVLLILAYYGTYLNALRGERLGAWRSVVLGLTAVILLWVGFLFTNNTSLMLTPERWPDLYFAAPGGTSLNISDPVVWPRYLHMALGAVAVAGGLLALLARAEKADRALADHLAERGVALFLGATALNVLVGFWQVMALREDVMRTLMGGSATGTALLGGGVVLAVVLLAQAFWMRGRAATAGLGLFVGALLAQMVVMVLLRHEVRGAYLGGTGSPALLAVESQWLNFGIFAALLAAGAATVAWMLRKLFARG
jgi:hypothetical protein